MRSVIHWVLLPAAVGGTYVAPTATATTYLTFEQAREAIFPKAQLVPASLELTPEQRKEVEKKSGVKVRIPQVKAWRVEGPSGGWLFVDEVIGKHDFITYAVGLDNEGVVKQVEVMDYRENYGSEVRRADWRSQFVGKSARSKLQLTEDIRNVSGATLSCRHVTEGVRRLLMTYEIAFKR